MRKTSFNRGFFLFFNYGKNLIMSLIVARKDGSSLAVVSDTKLTYPDETRTQKTNPADGIVKTIILNSNLCISFAGEIDIAEKAFRNFGNITSMENVLDLLARYHMQSQGKTEFLACIGLPKPTIYKFKQKEI